MEPLSQSPLVISPNITEDDGRDSKMEEIRMLMSNVEDIIRTQAERISALEAKVVQLESARVEDRAAWQHLAESFQKTRREDRDRLHETITTQSGQIALLSQHLGTLTTQFKTPKHGANGLPMTSTVKKK